MLGCFFTKCCSEEDAWLGNFDSASTRFLLEGAKGPLRLNLGDTLCPPNLMIDHQVELLAQHNCTNPKNGKAVWHPAYPREWEDCVGARKCTLMTGGGVL